jgi:hypothetical protein
MKKLMESLREHNLTGEGLAYLLFIFLLLITWPVYQWMQHEWLFRAPLAVNWLASSAYFSVEIWILMFVSREFSQYPLMSMDAMLGGALFAVGAALRRKEATLDFVLGFNVASWIIIISTTILLMRVNALATRKSRGPK